ncbi:MAG: glycoside hydrolase family 6 protein, partial [Actinomadura rubrobrunea]|nr:glycoside hydrolase family 6 protein [Actinomadura rubrobrunea]
MLSAGAVAMAAPQAAAAEACTVSYKVNTWSGGFTATLSVTNLGDALKNWTLEWDFPGDQKVTGSWNTHVAQTGRHVALRNVAHNASLAKGATVTPGVQGTHSGAVTMPTAFKLNGRTCAVVPSSADPAVRSADARAAAKRAADRVDNPYQGAKVYVNPDWAAKASAEPGGNRVADQPTGVWMDRRAAITGTNGARGLREHLDTALQQGANLVQVVIYNLPGRDCAALASNGELGPDDLDIYQTEFIDPIAEIFQDPKYANLRIVTVVEIDSLPNLITNVSPRSTATENCNRMKENGNYQKGIAYALRTFGAIPNVYNYLDIGHHGWLGWDDNFQPTVDLLAQVARDSGSMANVHGFITNTANYGVLTEPYFSINDTVNGRSVRESKWVDWNRYVDELSYAQAMRRALAQAGFGDGTGMLIDTSRNGWGGP